MNIATVTSSIGLYQKSENIILVPTAFITSVNKKLMSLRSQLLVSVLIDNDVYLVKYDPY